MSKNILISKYSDRFFEVLSLALPLILLPILGVFIFIQPIFVQPLHAESLIIAGGGSVEGKLLTPLRVNSQGEPVAQDGVVAEIEVLKGLVIGVDAAVIKEKIDDDKDDRVLYNKFAALQPDTVPTHLEIAEWCTTKRLSDLATFHWNRVIELDPNNELARKKLGYFKDSKTGQWTTTDERMSKRGYVYYKGNWITPQEKRILEGTTDQKDTTKQWKKSVQQMRQMFGNAEMRRKFTEIDDPAAVAVIIDELKREKSPDIRIVYIRTLSNIGTLNAIQVIAGTYMNDPNEEVRGTCLDQLKKHPQWAPTIGAYLGKFLGSGGETADVEPPVINRAAYAIGEIGDRSSVGKLIDTLVTRHKREEIIGSAGLGGGTFSSSGIGMSQGTSKKTTIFISENEDVLFALRKLTGVNFRYDQEAWRSWLKEKRKVVPVDIRRG
ncbi:MAG: HEAT repeat domain-containing protein [Thermoguttaceae bacterium]